MRGGGEGGRFRPDSQSSYQVITVGCQTHWTNLLCKDIIKDVSVVDRVLEVIRWFGDNHAAHAGLRSAGIPMPPKPSKTRFVLGSIV